MLSRFTVTMYVSMAVAGGQMEIFCPGDLAIFGILFFALVLLSRRNSCNLFCDCNSFGVWKRFLLIEVGFFLLLIDVCLGHGVEGFCRFVTVVAVL